MKIYLDAGHGNNEPGAVNGARKEYNDNYIFVEVLEEWLKYKGYTVIKSTPKSSALERAYAANDAGADLLLSFHRNSAVNAIANGIEVYHYGAINSAIENLAASWLTELSKIGFTNRGLKAKNLNILVYSKMPSLLFETGFISNSKDNDIFDSNLVQIVTKTGELITKYFPLPHVEPVNHWAQPYFDYLKSLGISFSDTRFTDACTRGEMFAALAKLTGYDTRIN